MSYSVVLIDDEPWTREVLKSLGHWERLNLKVVGEASDGEYGLELIRRLTPDIILTDIKMPRQNGIDLLKKLRETDHRARVIVISGYDDFAYVRSAMHLDVTDYLLKPVKADELNRQLERCVSDLDHRRHEEKDRLEGMDGFLHVSWVGEYMNQRSGLLLCLRSGKPDIIQGCFERMLVLPGTEEALLSKALLVAMYYDLMGALQRHIAAEGFVVDEVFEQGESAFVFSQDTTYSVLINHVRKVYLSAVIGMEKLMRNKNRLDLCAVTQYARDNACRGITLEETAAHFFVTREYMSKAFKGYAGESFTDFIMRLRMEKAREMICTLHMPVKEASEMTGFSDLAHFYKAFKRYFHMTPGDMAKSGL